MRKQKKQSVSGGGREKKTHLTSRNELLHTSFLLVNKDWGGFVDDI